MNELEKLLGLPQRVNIGNIEVEIHPLVLEDLAVLSSTTDKEGFKEIIKKCLKKSFPEATDEQLDQTRLDFINEFMLQVYKVSGLKIDPKKLDQMTAE